MEVLMNILNREQQSIQHNFFFVLINTSLVIFSFCVYRTRFIIFFFYLRNKQSVNLNGGFFKIIFSLTLKEFSQHFFLLFVYNKAHSLRHCVFLFFFLLLLIRERLFRNLTKQKYWYRATYEIKITHTNVQYTFAGRYAPNKLELNIYTYTHTLVDTRTHTHTQVHTVGTSKKGTNQHYKQAKKK